MQAVEHIAGNGLTDGRQRNAGDLPLNSGRHSSGQYITLADFAVVTSAGYVSEINAVHLGVLFRQRRGVDRAALGGGQHVAGAHLSGRAAGGHCRQLHTLFRRQLFGVGSGGHGAVQHRQLRGGRGGLRCRLNRSGSGCIGGGDRRVGDLLTGLADVADGLQHGNGGLVVNELGQQDTGGRRFRLHGDLVGLDLHDGLVLLHMVADLLQPADQAALLHVHAGFRHKYLSHITSPCVTSGS